jgi:hypothetical protein
VSDFTVSLQALQRLLDRLGRAAAVEVAAPSTSRPPPRSLPPPALSFPLPGPPLRNASVEELSRKRESTPLMTKHVKNETSHEIAPPPSAS